jgi:enoyl-CoA hydratase/carnithine racemase
VKQQIYQELSMSFEEALEHALKNHQAKIADTEEGFRSFVEKRHPKFTGE